MQDTLTDQYTGRNGGSRPLHPWPVRAMHWTNAVAVLMMIGSGWRIYNNDPIFSFIHFTIPLTLGGDEALTYKLHGDAGFGNALLWHLAFMWLLVVNGLAYVGYGVATGRFRRMLWPIRPTELFATVKDALRLKLGHDDLTMYNAVQKTMYVGVILALMTIVAAGLAIWKPVQFHGLTMLFGGFQGARLVHFLAMLSIVLFLAIHVSLALVVPQTLKAMVTGGPAIPVAPRPVRSAVPGE